MNEETEADNGKALAPLALEVDHLIIKGSCAQELYRFFSETLGFPVAFEFKDVVPGVFAAGMVSVGNLHLECAQVGPGSAFSIPVPGRAEFGGLCMDADRQFGPEELSKRGLLYEVLAPLAPDGNPMFTNYKLAPLTNEDQQFSLTRHRESFDPIARKRRLGAELEKKAGGPLGVICAKEIVIGTSELDSACTAWQQLLGTPIAPCKWRLTDGDPTLTMVKADHHASILSVTVIVKSLKTATEFLKARGALDVDAEDNLLIKGPHSEGLTIKIVGPE